MVDKTKRARGTVDATVKVVIEIEKPVAFVLTAIWPFQFWAVRGEDRMSHQKTKENKVHQW